MYHQILRSGKRRAQERVVRGVGPRERGEKNGVEKPSVRTLIFVRKAALYCDAFSGGGEGVGVWVCRGRVGGSGGGGDRGEQGMEIIVYDGEQETNPLGARCFPFFYVSMWINGQTQWTFHLLLRLLL